MGKSMSMRVGRIAPLIIRTLIIPSVIVRASFAALVVLVLSHQASAATAGTAMPWETPLQTIADSITGPVAKAVGVLVIAITGLGMAFSEGGSWLRKGVSIVFGLAIAFTASSFALTFFNFTGGAGF
jgi:type IV secretory pathway VirB2 component (pilin)